TIGLASPLPDIAFPLILDGTSEPGYAGRPLIELTGFRAFDGNGLTILGGGSTIKGLVINYFAGIAVELKSDGNVLEGNWIGLNASGTNLSPNSGDGVFISSGSNNRIGGTTAGAGNVISGNSDGIGISDSLEFPTGNVILGNKIGTDVTGTVRLTNGNGIYLSGAFNTTIGGTTAG